MPRIPPSLSRQDKGSPVPSISPRCIPLPNMEDIVSKRRFTRPPSASISTPHHSMSRSPRAVSSTRRRSAFHNPKIKPLRSATLPSSLIDCRTVPSFTSESKNPKLVPFFAPTVSVASFLRGHQTLYWIPKIAPTSSRTSPPKSSFILISGSMAKSLIARPTTRHDDTSHF